MRAAYTTEPLVKGVEGPTGVYAGRLRYEDEGQTCEVCGRVLMEGDHVAHVALGALADTDRAKRDRGEAYTAAAQIVHARCAGVEVPEQ